MLFRSELAAAGCAILMISSELPEVLNLSTRVIVMRNGRLAGELNRADATAERVLKLMTGCGEEKDFCSQTLPEPAS